MKFFTDVNGIKCWVCGEDAKPYNTNPFDPNRPRCSKRLKNSAIIFSLAVQIPKIALYWQIFRATLALILDLNPGVQTW